jgi:hypothetical protein
MQHVFAIMLQAEPYRAAQPLYADNVSMWRHMSGALHQSLYRVVTLLTTILPGVLAFIVSLAVFTLAGMVISALLRRALVAFRFDDRFAHGQSSVAWAPSSSLSELIARVSFWACVLLGLIIGVSAFDAAYATAAAPSISFLPYFTRIVGAVFLLVAGNVIARFLARSVLIGAVNEQLQYARFLSLGVKWLVLVLTAAMVLDHLQIGGLVAELAFGILFGGIVLTLALAVGLGSRDLVSRSLESHVERTNERSVAPMASPVQSSADPILHI